MHIIIDNKVNLINHNSSQTFTLDQVLVSIIRQKQDDFNDDDYDQNDNDYDQIDNKLMKVDKSFFQTGRLYLT